MSMPCFVSSRVSTKPVPPENNRLDHLLVRVRGSAECLLHDARTALRGMRRNPGYASAVVLTLALGLVGRQSEPKATISGLV